MIEGIKTAYHTVASGGRARGSQLLDVGPGEAEPMTDDRPFFNRFNHYLTAIRDDQYHDGHDPINNRVWTWSPCDGFGKSAGGIMASLVKKGLAGTDGETCWITQEGFDSIKEIAHEWDPALRGPGSCIACLPPSEDEPHLNTCERCGGIETVEWTAAHTEMVSGFTTEPEASAEDGPNPNFDELTPTEERVLRCIGDLEEILETADDKTLAFIEDELDDLQSRLSWYQSIERVKKGGVK